MREWSNFIFFPIMIVALLCSCGGDDCGSVTSRPFFDVDGIQEARHFSSDFSSGQLVDGDSLSYEDYAGVYLSFDVSYTTDYFERPVSSWTFFPTAFACSPIPPGYDGAKTESIAMLDLISQFDFDDTHLTNSSLNDLFDIQPAEYLGSEEQIMSLTNFLEEQESEKMDASEYFLILDKAPVLSNDFQIKILVSLSNGEQYEVLTDRIKITN